MKQKLLRLTACILMSFSCLLITGTALVSVNVERQVDAATLKQGSRGEEVKTLQRKLKNWGYYSGAVDGIFGAKTKEAVKYFQRKNGLTVDGIAGAKTLAALGMSVSSSSSSSTSSDEYLLARLIYGEARGESDVGQVAVGAVVLNRVDSSSFPDTVSGVVYQAGAFPQ